MKNRLLKYLYSNTTKSLTDGAEKDQKLFQHADQIIIWIVGFALGIFILLTSQIDSKSPFGKVSNLIICISLIVAVSGLLYRLSSFFTQLLAVRIITSFETYVEVFLNSPNLDIRKIKDTDTLEDIIRFLQEDFNEKINQNFDNIPNDLRIDFRNRLILLYNQLVEENNFEKQLENYKQTVGKYFGISSKRMKRISDDAKNIKRGKIYRKLLVLSYCLFTLTIILFISGIVILLVNLNN